MSATLEYKQEGGNGWVIALSDDLLGTLEVLRSQRMIPNKGGGKPPFVPEFSTVGAMLMGAFEARILKPAVKMDPTVIATRKAALERVTAAIEELKGVTKS
jgi:hypothetical protein